MQSCIVTTAGQGNRQQYVVLMVTGRRAEGELRYEDVRDRIRDQLGNQLAIRRYIATWRPTIECPLGRSGSYEEFRDALARREGDRAEAVLRELHGLS